MVSGILSGVTYVTESNTEAEKGLASDSFKRACVNWGIGRELYSAPKIWIPAEKCNLKTGKNGKPACYDKFSVAKLTYKPNGDIENLAVQNDTKKMLAFVHQNK